EVDDAQLGLARLTLTEELSRATDLEVAPGEVKPVEREIGATLALRHRGETLGLVGLLADQHRVRALPSSTDAPAQLVQLREAEALGAQHHHDRGVRDVDPDLDHRGRDEDVD